MSPIGVATAMPRHVSTMLPTMALASPPPSLPGPGVTSVKMRGVSAPRPFHASMPRIQPRTKTPSAVKTTQMTFMARSATRREERTRPQVVAAGAPPVAAMSVDLHARNERARDREDHEGHHEQHAAERDERAHLQPERLVELVGDARRDGAARLED